MDDCCAAHFRRRRLPTFHYLFASLLYLVALPNFAGVAQAEKIHFHIEAGEFEDTITQFGDQAHVLVSYANDNFAGIRTNAVSGEFEIAPALSLLLQGTPLVAQWRRDPDGNQWVVIRLTKPEGSTSTYHIDGGNAALTLNDFSQQSGVQILFDFNIVNKLSTQSIDGSYSANDAVAHMLRGTGLVYEWVNDHTLAVTPSNRPGARLARWWQRLKQRFTEPAGASASAEVVIAANRPNDAPPPGAPTIAIGHAELEQSGVLTTEEFLRTRPELFGGGPNEGTVLGVEQQSNTALGVGANYRGLGAGATVALVNGRPIAPSGSSAAFADVSNIPLSAIDHIEMIPEGGTSLYGGEAEGGVINFVLRAAFDGAQTRVHNGFAQGHTLGEQQLDQLWGTHWGESSMLVALEYYRRDALFASDRALATSDLTPFGGSNLDTPFGNPGTLLVGSQTWAIPRGQDGRSLTRSEVQPGTQAMHDLEDGTSILPAQRRVNLYTHSTLPIGESAAIFADALVSERWFTNMTPAVNALLTVPASNPYYFNPTEDRSQPVQIMYGFLSDLGPLKLSGHVLTGNFAIGIDHMSWSGWNATVQVGYAFERQHTYIDNLVDFGALDAALADRSPVTAFNPFGDGSQTNPSTLMRIRSEDQSTVESPYWFARVNADRDLLALPGGDLKLLLGSDWHRQQLVKTSASPLEQISEDLSRSVWVAFGELRIPLIGAANRLPAVESLELSAAERLQRYSDVGAVLTPSFTAVWSPLRSVRFRATDARIFKAPTLADLSTVNNGSELIPVPDSQSPMGQSLALVIFGGNSTLRPERGRSWSLGLDFRPVEVPGLTLAVTHFAISLDGRVNTLSLSSNVLGDLQFASLVNRNPTPKERARACGGGIFYSGDLDSCVTTMVPIVDARARNLSRISTSGYDLALKYALPVGAGKLEFGLNGTYVSRFTEAFTSASPMTNIVNTDHNPLAVRARAWFDYRVAAFEAGTFLNYAGHYRDVDSVPQRPVAAWTTIDAQVSYDLKSMSESGLNDLRLSLSVQNLFGQNPPFLNNQVGVGWDQENATPFGRQLRFGLQKRW